MEVGHDRPYGLGHGGRPGFRRTRILGFSYWQTKCILLCLHFRKTNFRKIFSSNGNNLFLLLAQVETVFLGTPYFSATSLFDIPFSRSFNALDCSIRDLFLCIRLCGAMIMRKVRVKKHFDETFLKTSNQNIRKFFQKFGWKFELTRENCPRDWQKCLRNREIWVTEIPVFESFLPKLLCNGQGTGEFVWVLETFEFSSIQLIESVLYSLSCVFLFSKTKAFKILILFYFIFLFFCFFIPSLFLFFWYKKIYKY